MIETLRGKTTPRAFTLVEMMVVLTVSLLLMTMIVPIFRLSTKTVQVVERKLAVYESARNVLDLIEAEMQLAITTDKGEHFSIKHVSWLDTDPFTPPFGGPPIMPGTTDPTNMAFKHERRISDAVNYVRLEGHGTNTNWVPSMRMFPGGKFFPMSYPILENYYPDGWKCSMRSTLLYQHDFEQGDGDSDAGQKRWSRAEQLGDVSQVELAFIFETIANQWEGVQPVKTYYDQCPNFLGPGREIKVPHLIGPTGGAGQLECQRQRRLGDIKVMDLAVSYWDDVQKKYQDLPENTVVYFFPMPKAIRTTITVCDIDKRTTLTLCRITQLPCGSGDGNVLLNAAGAADTAYYTDKVQPNNTTFAVYNRTKYLPALPNAFNGDASRGDLTTTSDFSSATENTIITQDGVKPYQWP